MKQSLVYFGLLSVMSTAVYALPELSTENYPKRDLEIATNAAAPQVATASLSTTVTTSTTTATTPAAGTTQQPATVTVTQPVSATVTPAAPPVIDCTYKIPATTAKIDQSIVKEWTEKAVMQSFDFDYNTIGQQLSALQPCFTDQGWQSFSDALQKSGNMKAITSEKLTVSSMMDGQLTLTEIKDNQWKADMPLQVVYQNEKEKLTQSLTVDLTIGRKTTGELGIMQIIATPRPQAATNSAAPAAVKTTTTVTTTAPASQ